MLSWHHTARTLTSPICWLVVGEHCRVVCKLNDGVGVVCSYAVMVEQGVQEGIKHAPLTGHLLPTLTTWGRPVRKSRNQLKKEMFSPSDLSVVISFQGTMVLNTEL